MVTRNALVMISGAVREMPSGDSLNGAGSVQVMTVRDEKTANTSGGTPGSTGTWLTRDLNTVGLNTISGASLSSNQITLPAGTYLVDGSVPGYRLDMNKARLYNVTGSAVLVVGTPAYGNSDPAAPGSSFSLLKGGFTLATSSVIRIEHSVATATGNGFGRTAGQSAVEIYSEITLQKI